MILFTLNFLTCNVKTCKSSQASYPLHLKDIELASDEKEFNPQGILNWLPRLDWAALKIAATELGLPSLPESIPTPEELQTNDSRMMRELHTLLFETHIVSGKLVCGNCGHEYGVKEGIANFLLPSHLI